MWQVHSSTGLPAEGGWIQDKSANKIWLVCIKATFDIDPPSGKTTLSDRQVELFKQPQPNDGDFANSLHYESDLFGFKPCTDILVNGSAWAPDGKPVEQVDAGFQLGPVRKRLRVFGDRHWSINLAGVDFASAPKPFLHVPLVYERAYGGWDTTDTDPARHRMEARNPVGCGFVTNPAAKPGRALPNVEDPANLIGNWQDRPAPAGFAPVSCDWSPRRELAGTYDAAWQKSRFPLWAEDLDPRYYCCAPRDQQAEGYLKGGEPVHLINLSPHGPIRFTLPRLTFGFATRIRREIHHHQGTLATVILEPDYPRVILVWQSAIMCNHQADYLDETTIRLKKRI